MMVDLKTLKEFDGASRYDINEGLAVVCVDDLREEAKKHKEELERMECYLAHRADAGVDCYVEVARVNAKIEWIKHFFNLED